MNDTLHSILLHLHSIGRWALLLLMLIAIFKSLGAGDKPFTKSHAKTGLLVTITADTMLLIGLVLWIFGPIGYSFISQNGFKGSMGDPVTRFYAIEHFTGMLIAIGLLHIGKAQAKKSITDKKKHARTVVFYVLALVIMLATIPWPFRAAGAGRGWF